MTAIFHQHRTRSPLTVLALTVVLAMALSGCDSAADTPAGMPPPPQVSAAPVLVKEVSQWDEYTGHIEAVESVELRPRVSGYIQSVAYREGQEVKAGDVLFTIDDRSYRAEVARAQAQLARARSQAAQSRSEAERARALAKLQAVSTEVLEQRNSEAAVAQAEVQAAQAALDAAKLNLDWTQVRAPIAGRAGRALVTTGNLVSAGDAASVLTTLVAQDRMYAYFDADEAAFLRYSAMARDGSRPSEREGKVPVRVGLADESGFPHEGVVDFLDNQVNRTTGMIRVRAVLDNTERRYTPGLFARVQLLGSGRFNAMLIDEQSVLTDQNRKYVYVVDEQGRAQRKDIQLGRSVDGMQIVERGLADGDRVVVRGVQKIFMPGMPVQAEAVSMQGAGAPVAMN